jgi:hypothetical protein
VLVAGGGGRKDRQLKPAGPLICPGRGVSPDEQVRAALERGFVLWRRLGSARQVVVELIAEGQKLPRGRVGERRCGSSSALVAEHDFGLNARGGFAPPVHL